MIFVRFTAIASLVIALAILVVSNPTPTLSLLFLGGRTVPISVGLLCLAALGSGLLGALTLRSLLWSYVASGAKTIRSQTKTVEQPEFSDQSPMAAAPEYPEEYHRDRLDNYDRPQPNLESVPNDVVRDANYRVIRPPQNTPPASEKPRVESTLKPDSEDWGFDFDEDN
jgi:hypothetical protein